MSISIVAATEDDIAQVLEIEREAISPPWTHGALLSEIYSGDSFFSVAAREGTVLGFVILRRMGDESELLQIAVSKAARRNGIADLLMDAALGYAETNALSSVFLEVRASNAAAIKLYEKHGFAPVRSRKDYYLDPVEDAIVMARGT